MSAEKIYRSGEQVPKTGLYSVSPYQHRMPHDGVLRHGELFPACNRCGERVAFRLSASTTTVSDDQDFVSNAA